MFERVITQTIQRISHDVLRERSLVSLTDILEDERIPERLKPFFVTEVQWWLYNESLVREANRRFDYEQPELASLLNYLERVQFKYARFEREEFLAVLDSAVKLTHNYLCRPQTTLKWYIFRGQPVKPLREVMLRFDAVSDYEYFRNVFIDWVESKQNERATFDAISATEFERVIRRTDDQILLNCTVEDLLAIMTPLFEFVGEGEAQRVPVDALVIFFDDKNIKRLVDHLERYRERGHEFTTREEFVSLLDDLLSVADDEPEADFSQVYQNDELDDVVRRHIGAGQEGGSPDTAAPDAEPVYDVEPVAAAGVSADAAPVEAETRAVPGAAGPVSAYRSGVPGDRLVHNGEMDVPPLSAAMHEPEPTADAEPAVSAEREVQGAEAQDIAPDVDVAAAVKHSRAAAEESSRSVASIQSSVDLPAQFPEVGRRPFLSEPDAQLATPMVAPASAAPGPIDPADVPVEPVGPVEEKAEPWPPSPDVVIPTLMTEAEIIERERGEGLRTVDIADLPSPASGSGSSAPVPVPVPAPRPTVAASQTAASPIASTPGSAATSPAAPSAPKPVAEPMAAASSTPPPVDAQMPAVPSEIRPDASTDVRRYIDSSLERKVIKKIFGKSRQEYDQAIQKLNAAENWRIASQILDELFIRFDVDPYSRTAVRFTDSVYGRYLSRGE